MSSIELLTADEGFTGQAQFQCRPSHLLLLTPATMTELSDKISAAIEGSPYNAREVAELVGVHESTVSLWINGERTPRVKHLEKLAQVLGREIGEFWAGPEATPATATQAAMVDEMAQLDPVQQEALLALARSMRAAKP
jgi:transcriptional regulator with XRE-family HTH domain